MGKSDPSGGAGGPPTSDLLRNHRPVKHQTVESAKERLGHLPAARDQDGLRPMERTTTFAAFAVFAFLVGSSPAVAEQSNGTGPVRLKAPGGQAPAPLIKPTHENPAPGSVGVGQGRPQSTTDRPSVTGMEHPPSDAVQKVRPRAVYRGVARRIDIAGGVLVLPAIVYYGVPVILNVPELGYVDVPEEEYARLYDKLSSSDSEQVQEAMSSLRKIKALEEAEVEAVRRGPERTEPDHSQDLSEPIFFDSPSRVETRRRRLY